MLQFFTKQKEKKGFTLIELLVVIAVIGLLSTVVLVRLGPVRQKGRDAKRIADLRQIMTAQEMYYAAQAPNEVYAGQQSVLVPDYLPDTLKDPKHTHAYCYDKVNTNCNPAGKLTSTGSAATTWGVCADLEGDGSFGCSQKGCITYPNNDCNNFSY